MLKLSHWETNGSREKDSKMNATIKKAINLNLDENEILLILLALAEAKEFRNDWNYRSDKQELYTRLFNEYVDLTKAGA